MVVVITKATAVDQSAEETSAAAAVVAVAVAVVTEGIKKVGKINFISLNK